MKKLQSSTKLFAEDDNKWDAPKAMDESTTTDPAPVKVEEEEEPFVIDLPSPILLASAIISAIVSTGCLFDLLAGSPAYGFAATAAIPLLGFPLCIFCFLSAIAKGQQETDEDDAKFKNNGGF